MIYCTVSRLMCSKSMELLVWDEFYDLPKNSVDVLNVGSSYAHTSINTEILWNEFGISTFCLSSGTQPLYTSYYYVKEALKTQSPKALLLECSMANVPFEENPYGAIASKAGIRGIDNKLGILKESVVLPDKMVYSTNVLSSHNRWRELSNDDFKYLFGKLKTSSKGFYAWMERSDIEENELELRDTKEIIVPLEESIQCMDKIVELCEENGVTLIPYYAPKYRYEDEYMVSNYWKKYFSEKDIYVIDGLDISEEIDFDAKYDISKKHTSYWGSTKFSRYVAQKLIDSGVEDRRSDAKYAEWFNDSHHYEMLSNSYLLCYAEYFDQYVNQLKMAPENIIVVVTKTDNDEIIENGFKDIMKPTNVITEKNEGYTVDVFSTTTSSFDKPILVQYDDQIQFVVDYKRILDTNDNAIDRDENVIAIYVYNLMNSKVVDIALFNTSTGERLW